ncbi:hypothetical protein I41_12720 [Lacipirellula limnantheis]|uniref:Uncharacterized protein n=1 Tax=Lacipirellula limnantheis TaxID=2528024 RepID=A0A517TUQ5_9BACT|nr:hypothetical protein I41_12720 [Lacipirellula limnantheis]
MPAKQPLAMIHPMPYGVVVIGMIIRKVRP